MGRRGDGSGGLCHAQAPLQRVPRNRPLPGPQGHPQASLPLCVAGVLPDQGQSLQAESKREADLLRVGPPLSPLGRQGRGRLALDRRGLEDAASLFHGLRATGLPERQPEVEPGPGTGRGASTTTIRGAFATPDGPEARFCFSCYHADPDGLYGPDAATVEAFLKQVSQVFGVKVSGV